MNTPVTRSAARATPAPAAASRLRRGWAQAKALLERIPNSLIAFIARFSMAAVFWNSGQTKVQAW